jgi:hypothetical protein
MYINSSDANYAADEDKVSMGGFTRQMVDSQEWLSRIKDPNDLDVLPFYNCTAYGSRRQRLLAQSSTEAEYITGADTVKVMRASSQKWEALGFESMKPEELYVDNTAMMRIAEDWKLTDRTRHIDIRYHHIRFHVVKGEIVMMKVDTTTNISDMFTKCLDQRTLERHRGKIMIGNVNPNYRPRSRTRISRYIEPAARRLRKKQIAMLKARPCDGSIAIGCLEQKPRVGPRSEDEVS